MTADHSKQSQQAEAPDETFEPKISLVIEENDIRRTELLGHALCIGAGLTDPLAAYRVQRPTA